MRASYYPKMAWSGMKKNKRLYVPYLLTCIGMVMMQYIMAFLCENPLLKRIPGGGTMQVILGMGYGVIGVFALIFLFYTNSFLIRRRKREFGLYNVLGMGKKNLARILWWEGIMTAGIALAGGLAAGILLSKFAELCMVNLMQGEVSFSFNLSGGAIRQTALWFAGVFLLILLNSLRQIRMSNPVELLRSEHTGEKPPKANWLFALAGVILLGAAYTLAVRIENPVEALVWFFVAVIMVIVATYLLFMSGSVTVCRLLQKKRNYYYQTNHFVSVSSMAYRMKRSGAGLASICILCTMVLVMISSTSCLFIGKEDSLRGRYPRHINLETQVAAGEGQQLDEETADVIRQAAAEAAREYGDEPFHVLDYRLASLGGYWDGTRFVTDISKIANFNQSTYADVWQIFLVPLEDYNRLMGQQESLQPGEALLYATKTGFSATEIVLGDQAPIRVQGQAERFVENGVDAMQIIPSLFLFVPDFDAVVGRLAGLDNGFGRPVAESSWLYAFDLQQEGETQIRIYKALREQLKQREVKGELPFHVSCESREAERSDFYGVYAGLFFLGILLGSVFLCAAVLMMYYKQISEGYEDQSRFEIMQKVGMTKADIRRSINSQMLTVFFLPLLTAGLHLAFAFPLVQKMLLMFGLSNLRLLILVTFGCFVIFALFYVLMYRVTSRAYYRIVSGAREEA